MAYEKKKEKINKELYEEFERDLSNHRTHEFDRFQRQFKEKEKEIKEQEELHYKAQLLTERRKYEEKLAEIKANYTKKSQKDGARKKQQNQRGKTTHRYHHQYT